jgi:hypothetical protein
MMKFIAAKSRLCAAAATCMLLLLLLRCCITVLHHHRAARMRMLHACCHKCSTGEIEQQTP